MDYEKAYNEALKRARDYSEGHSLDVNPQAAMAYVFPELKECEDEKIRKAIVELVKQSSNILNPMSQKSMIDWLEKHKKGVENWPNLTNCKHDCKSCMGKCFYRKEPYQGEKPAEWFDEEKLKDGLDKAAADWNSKAYFSPIAMVMDGNGYPCGTKQYTTTHADSFKAGVEWVIKKLKEFEA